MCGRNFSDNTKDLCSLGQQESKIPVHIIEVEGKIHNQPIAILVDYGAIHSDI
jgi:hypothetical protein